MKRMCRFTRTGRRNDQGTRGTRTEPYQYETFNLAPIRMWSMDTVGRFAQRRIEGHIAARETTPPCEYIGTDRERQCNHCPVCNLSTCMNRGNDSAA